MPLEGMGESKLCGLPADPLDLDLLRWMIQGKNVSLALDCSTATTMMKSAGVWKLRLDVSQLL